MPAYAYPINIERGFKTIIDRREVQIKQPLTIDQLMEHVEYDDCFTIYQTDWEETATLEITSKRSETVEERDVRVQREERYMVEYNKRHNQ